MTRPKLLDLFCCEGGASRGYDQAGFDVHGVDLWVDYSRKRYPYPGTRSDALTYLDGHWTKYDVVHASPPCQPHTAALRAERASGKHRPSLVAQTRDALTEWSSLTGRPWVIENVVGAELIDPVVLCGTMFGLTTHDDTDGEPLEMWRHREFESNVPLAAPGPCEHGRYSTQVAGSYGGARRDKVEARTVRHGGYVPSKATQQRLLGIDWMTERGMHQSLPPAYTCHLGRQLMEVIA